MTEDSLQRDGVAAGTADADLREALVALLVAAVLFAVPLAGGLLDPERVTFGVDTATAQLPWSAVLETDEAPRNPGLWDQGVGFYPFYRWVVRSWDEGDAPLWNPLVFTGAPALGNPQVGVLDPQVWLLGVAWALGGESAFHTALDLAGWLRLVVAGLGAYLLARRLGLARVPAALVGVTFGLSGYQVSWLNHGLGHVMPFLPWTLWGVEGTRGERPLAGVAVSAMALCLAILGGHPETAFFVGAAAGLWSLAVLARDRRAGSLALGGLALGTALGAIALLSFQEYLDASVAKAEREQLVASGGLDLVALGTLVALVGYVGVWRRGAARSGRPASVVMRAAGLALAFGAGAWVLASRGLSPGTLVTLVHDYFGAPGDGRGGYQGPRVLVEEASGWVASVALTLALASALSPALSRAGGLRRRGVVLALAGVSLGLCLRTPGLLDLFRQLPLVGLGDTGRFGAVSALMLALLAGDGLARASREARGLAALLVGLAVTAALGLGGVEPPEDAPGPEEDELFGVLVAPAAVLASDGPWIEGWVAPEVPLERAQLVATPVGEGAREREAFEIPLEVLRDASDIVLRRASPEALARVPEGAWYFRTRNLLVDRMGEGHWRLDVALHAGGDGPVATRRLSVLTISRPPRTRALTLVAIGVGLLLVAFAPRRALPALVLVAGVQGLLFADGKNPAVPVAEAFPETATERILARELGTRRYLAEPGVLPADTGMVRGLRAIDGYDGLHPLLWDALKGHALKPGTQRLLGWNARGVALDSAPFRLLGVGALTLASPLDAPSWELVASPDDSRGVEHAETWIYRATDPLPPAFVVGEVVTLDDLAARLASWDPLATAAYEGDWRPSEPLRSAEVTGFELSNNEVRLRARVEGDGLLVVTEGAFAGWTAEVNGEPHELGIANMALRGVPLTTGDHEVVLRYRSPAIRTGALVSAGAFAVWLVVAGLGLRQRAATPKLVRGHGKAHSATASPSTSEARSR